MKVARTAKWLSLGALGFLALLLAPVGESADGNPHGSLDLPCSDCHTTEGWRPLREPLEFDHASTGFALLLSHQSVECASCHQSLVFSHVPTACADCHDDPHRGELGAACEDCHAPAGWDNRREMFDVHGTTLMPLTGVHATLDCAACHQEAPPFEYSNTPVECFACHAEDYFNTSRIDHERVGFPTECELCHTPLAWDMARFAGGFGFEHDSFFELTGAHRTLDCIACHADGFSGTPTDCFSCHAADYEATTDPNHVESGFPTMCEDCHNTTDWEDADFDHDLFFRLTGAHRGLDCEECHADGFAGTPDQCVGCHRADYNDTDNPDHREAGFGTDCEDCHGTSTWEGATADHPFALTGAHVGLDCQDCHADGFAGTPDRCVGCHRADYNQTTDPNHRQAGFGTDCEDCHTTSTWVGAQVDHDQFFALTGAHRGLDCEECHADGFAGTPTDCFACHEAEYNATTDPNHREAGFPTDCEACHTTRTWQGAEFDHDNFWPLTGEHRGLDCEECHADGFAGTPTDCYACHEADYDQTTDPNHQSAGFPTDCELCHTTSGWDGADFSEHDSLYFPIFSGSHNNEWDSCTECHVVPSDFGQFECIFCHEHNQEEMDEEHEDVGGYVYQSTACLECHPNGEE